MRRAAKVDENQAGIVRALRSIGTSVLSLAALGKGVPDLLCYRAPVGFVLLEVKDGNKSPSRRTLTSAQRDFHDLWPVIVVESIDDAIRAVTGQKPLSEAAHICGKCKKRECAWYGAIGGYSRQCVECNAAQSQKRRAAYARRAES